MLLTVGGYFDDAIGDHLVLILSTKPSPFDYIHYCCSSSVGTLGELDPRKTSRQHE
jgi:hypothetical protein